MYLTQSHLFDVCLVGRDNNDDDTKHWESGFRVGCDRVGGVCDARYNANQSFGKFFCFEKIIEFAQSEKETKSKSRLYRSCARLSTNSIEMSFK